MKTRSLTSDGKLIEHAHGLGTVTRELIDRRAREIALINQRPEYKPTFDDWEEARRELTTAHDSANDPMEELPVDRRWDPVPGTRGFRTDNVAADDEQTLAEELVREGVEEAGHEQMVESARESEQQNREPGQSDESRAP